MYLAAHEHRKSGDSRRARRVKDSGYWIVYASTDLGMGVTCRWGVSEGEADK